MKAIGPNITPDIGGIYVHLKSGNRYTVHSVGKVKLPSQEWQVSVNYFRSDGSNLTTYTRTLADFQASFADSGDSILIE